MWENWALKDWCFWTWCWRRLLRVPWTARRSNQSILKEISPEYSLEGLMLKLKLQYFGHFMRRVDSLEKTLMLGRIEGRRRKGRQRMRWLDGIIDWWTWVWVNSRSWWWTGKPGMPRGHKEMDATEWLNWTNCFSSRDVQIWDLDHKESWEPKNWCFWTVLLGRLLRVPWTAKRSNQSIPKEINPEYSLERLLLKLKL